MVPKFGVMARGSWEQVRARGRRGKEGLKTSEGRGLGGGVAGGGGGTGAGGGLCT